MQATATKLNGVDTEALKAMMAEVSRDPAKGKATFNVVTRWAGAARTETSVNHWKIGGQRLARNFTVKTDEPEELLGDATAPNPQEVLMAGLNACMSVGYVTGCAVHGIELESLSIETEGTLDLRGFLGIDKKVKPGYDELHYTVRIRGKGTPEQFQKVHETVMATSPNFFNVSQPIRMVPRLVVE